MKKCRGFDFIAHYRHGSCSFLVHFRNTKDLYALTRAGFHEGDATCCGSHQPLPASRHTEREGVGGGGGEVVLVIGRCHKSLTVDIASEQSMPGRSDRSASRGFLRPGCAWQGIDSTSCNIYIYGCSRGTFAMPRQTDLPWVGSLDISLPGT